VFTVVVAAGDTITRNVFLAAGKYTVRFAAATRSGAPLPLFLYGLRGLTLDNPIGPESADAGSDPMGGSGSSGSSSYYWSGGSNSGSTPTDPYSNPYATT
jgi:hypothetical protein